MITMKECFPEMINAPAREIGARVELFEGSTLIDVFEHTGALKEFSVERMGEDGKFFGFGVCQKLEAKLADKERKINVNKNNYLEVEFGVGCEYVYPYPLFRVDDIARDENTNDLTVIAYDPIYDCAGLHVSDLDITDSYSIKAFASACAALMGLPITFIGIDESVLMTTYATGANFDGSETVREALNAVAEATQSIYYINHQWELTFKRLDVNGDAVMDINKNRYFNLTNKTDRTLTAVCHATELGDNVIAGTNSGVTQYVRENPFWTLREDIANIVENALAAIGGITINQFECSWRGNFAVEIGDKISMTTKDDQLVYGYVLNDTVTYNGGLSEKTSWTFTDREAETAATPTTLGEAIKNTYARVDKANQRIDMVVEQSETSDEELRTAVSALQIDTSGISATVSTLETQIHDGFGNLTDEVASIRSSVEAKMTEDQVAIKISEELSNGIDKVSTTTGFTFDNEGLSISKSGSQMETKITEDGMTVYRDNTAVLVANNEGVNAEDLHATTYLIIGETSRFEDTSSGRTACFWIGG